MLTYITASRIWTALLVLGTSIQLVAQEANRSGVNAAPPSNDLAGYQRHQPTAEEIEAGRIAGPMFVALRLRTEIANGVFSGTIKPEVALVKLRDQSSPSGLQLEEGADFAFAAIDVGQRLIGFGKPAEAALFFQTAEQSLDAVVKNTANSRAKEKSQYLQKLAHIRSRFLNKAAQAKADLEQAIALQPDDKNLQRAKENMARTNAAIFQNQTKS